LHQPLWEKPRFEAVIKDGKFHVSKDWGERMRVAFFFQCHPVLKGASCTLQLGDKCLRMPERTSGPRRVTPGYKRALITERHSAEEQGHEEPQPCLWGSPLFWLLPGFSRMSIPKELTPEAGGGE
jgi:hypothetical protein